MTKEIEEMVADMFKERSIAKDIESASDYAIKECSECGVRHPANEMIHKTYKMETGTSSGSTTHFKSNPSYALKGGVARQMDRTREGSSHTSGRTYYKTVTSWFCEHCYMEKFITEPRRRWHAFFFWSAAILLTILGVWMDFGFMEFIMLDLAFVGIWGFLMGFFISNIRYIHKDMNTLHDMSRRLDNISLVHARYNAIMENVINSKMDDKEFREFVYQQDCILEVEFDKLNK